MNTHRQNSSSVQRLPILVAIALFLNLTGMAKAQNTFYIGAWCFVANDDITDDIYFDRGNGPELYQSEKNKLSNLGLNYFIACVSPVEAQESLINYGNEKNGAFKITVEWTPPGYPGIANPYRVWEWSSASFGHGSLGDPNWAPTVNTGYAAIGDIYGGSLGFHSALVGAEHDIFEQDRWDEVQYMGNSVDNNITTRPISVVQNGWNSGQAAPLAQNIGDNDIFMMQVYPFSTATPSSGTQFQDAVQLMADRWGAVKTALEDGKELYAVLQTHSSVSYGYRIPSKEEILLSMNMALAYGATGIVHYLYAQETDQYGLLEDDRSTSPLYDEVADLHNTHLIPHGPKFLPLTWKEGYSIHTELQEPIDTGAKLYDVRSRIPGCSYDSEPNTYVEIGYFTDEAYHDYYMVVNRRADSNGTRTVKIRFQGSANTA